MAAQHCVMSLIVFTMNDEFAVGARKRMTDL